MDQMRDEIDAMRELIEDMMLLARLEVEGMSGGEPADVTEAVEDCLGSDMPTPRRRPGCGWPGTPPPGSSPPSRGGWWT